MQPSLQVPGAPAPARESHWEIADHLRTATCNPLVPASCPDWLPGEEAVYRRRRRSVCGRCVRTVHQRGKSEPKERALTVEVWTSIEFSPAESVHQARCRLFRVSYHEKNRAHRHPKMRKSGARWEPRTGPRFASESIRFATSA